ncbi:MAG: KilA-N domain-containing protein [Saprospiraceae bacterium]
MSKSKILNVKGSEISILSNGNNDFICLTDIAKTKESDSRAADIIKNWIRNRSTIEFIATWKQLYNPNFKVVEFDHFKMNAGLPSFVLSPGQWVEKTDAIGIYVQKGKFGGTYAHKDIAFEFCSAISPIFKIYLIKEFQRLKDEENAKLNINWNIQRTLSKVNYRIHTDAIKENLIPAEIDKSQAKYIYANEADVLNIALFGKTAKIWREENPNIKGNIRDQASIEQLVVLSNMESINAILIHQGIQQFDRLLQLNQMAISQMKSLIKHSVIVNKLK